MPPLKVGQDEAYQEQNAASRGGGPAARPDLAKMTAEREAKMARFRYC